MRFGVVLPTYPAGATIEGVVRVAQAAEHLGFVSAWTTDHVILPLEESGVYAEILEPLMTLAYVAAVTERIRLGISVIVVPQRNGIVLAKELATLDHLCRGRLIVGVGAGWNADEFRMLGAADRFHQRGRFLDETLQVWRHLWTTPETPFRGTFYDLPVVSFGPGPLQPGGPAIWVGGSSESARNRAGRVGAAWHPVGTPAEEIPALAAVVRAAADAAGRPMPEIAPRLPIALGPAPVGSMTAGRIQVLQAEPAAMIERLRAYEAAGVSEIDVLFGSSDGSYVVGQMERFSAEVMPAFGSGKVAMMPRSGSWVSSPRPGDHSMHRSALLTPRSR